MMNGGTAQFLRAFCNLLKDLQLQLELKHGYLAQLFHFTRRVFMFVYQ